MFGSEDYREVASIESMGGKSTIGVKVLVTREIGFVDGIAEDGSQYKRLVFGESTLSDEECNIVSRHCEQMQEEILMSRFKRDPEVIADQIKVKESLLDCFPYMWKTIPVDMFVQEIPNQYCSRHCCLYKPWLVVTTTRGKITIGWRKRVISIDWSDSHVKATAQELFPLEDVTKVQRSIHAWSYDKAKEYIQKVLDYVKI